MAVAVAVVMAAESPNCVTGKCLAFPVDAATSRMSCGVASNWRQHWTEVCRADTTNNNNNRSNNSSSSCSSSSKLPSATNTARVCATGNLSNKSLARHNNTLTHRKNSVAKTLSIDFSNLKAVNFT